jgi:hypothetical protein
MMDLYETLWTSRIESPSSDQREVKKRASQCDICELPPGHPLASELSMALNLSIARYLHHQSFSILLVQENKELSRLDLTTPLIVPL